MTIAHSAAYSIKEEFANALSHGLGTILSIIGLIMLVNYAISENNIIKIISFSIYGSSLVLLFLSSTIYHSITNVQSKKIFKLLDHCAIYLLIAGTYTPLMLITLQGPLGYSMLALVWFIALAGIWFKVTFGHKYKKISLSTYLGMGFISLPILHKLSVSLPEGGLALLTLGGGVYCFGVYFYVQKKIPYNHAIWHLFVLGGASCHFFMMWYYV